MSTMSNDKRATKPGHSTSPLSRRTLIALTALCIVSLLGHIALLPHMPEMIPTHWDAAGTVDGWTGRTAIVALDALPLLFLFMFHIIPRIDPRGPRRTSAWGCSTPGSSSCSRSSSSP